MAAGQQRNQPLPASSSAQALDRFKYEVAQEVASTSGDAQAQLLQQWYTGQTGGYGGDIPSRLWGAVGGHMVRRMIAAAEQDPDRSGGAKRPAGLPSSDRPADLSAAAAAAAQRRLISTETGPPHHCGGLFLSAGRGDLRKRVQATDVESTSISLREALQSHTREVVCPVERENRQRR